MPDRQDIAILLEHSPSPSTPQAESSISAKKNAMLARRRQRVAARAKRKESEERKIKVEQERERWVRDWARVVVVDPEVLLPPKRRRKWRKSQDSGLGSMDGDDTEVDEVLESADDSSTGDHSLVRHCDDEILLWG
jgi:protein subunit release factor B